MTNLYDVRKAEIEKEAIDNKLRIAKVDLKIAEFKYRMALPILIVDSSRTLAEIVIALVLVLWALGKL